MSAYVYYVVPDYNNVTVLSLSTKRVKGALLRGPTVTILIVLIMKPLQCSITTRLINFHTNVGIDNINN